MPLGLKAAKAAARRDSETDALRREITDADAFERNDVNTTITRRKRALVQRMAQDLVPRLAGKFEQYDNIPIRIARAQSHDIGFEFREERRHGEPVFASGGAWFGFRFGRGLSGPPNDVPNISIIFYDHGLDVTLNAEIGPSQRIFTDQIAQHPAEFDEIIAAVSGLELKTYLKLEHQPRAYYWILADYLSEHEVSADAVARLRAKHEREFPANREKWLLYIENNSPYRTPRRDTHLRRVNRNLNLAWRIVKTIGPDAPMWQGSHSDQVKHLEGTISAFKPLIEFFVPAGGR